MIKVYKRENKDNPYDYVLELWEASTKHPDSMFFFEDFQKVEYFTQESQIFQWLIECASKLTWKHHAKELVDYAIEKWYNVNRTEDITE